LRQLRANRFEASGNRPRRNATFSWLGSANPRSSLPSLWYPAVNKQIYPWQFSCFISTYGGPMKWLHPIERIVETLFVAWLLDLFCKPVSRYRQPMHRKQEFI
jgi:hypothetical protein